MINYNYITDYQLNREDLYSGWIEKMINSENRAIGELNYIFCDDEYLLKINKEYLNHDTLTDIITFDYTQENELSGDIFISVERVRENGEQFGGGFEKELLRVMSHGVLHLVGYGDKGDKESMIMRQKEDEKINMFHVEQ